MTNKYLKLLTIILSAAILFTACSGGNNSEEETTAVSSAEQIRQETNASESTTESSTASQTEESTVETSVSEEENAETEAIQLTADTKYYEMRLSTDDVISSEDDFEDKELLEQARQAAQEKLSENEYGNYNNSDSLNTAPELTQALIKDFDQDGQTEYVMIFENDLISGDFKDVLIFADKNKKLTVDDEIYACDSKLYELQYSGFSHLILSGGVSADSSVNKFFSFNDNQPECETNQFQLGEIKDNFAFSQTYPMLFCNYLLFWNNDEQCYVTPAPAEIKEEEKAELEKLADDYLNDNNMEKFGGEYTVGNKYYSVWSVWLMKNDDGSFSVVTDDDTIGSYTGDSVRQAVGFDYETALNNLIPVD